MAWHSAQLVVFVVGCLQTTLRCCAICLVRSGVTAMITEASYPDSLRPALAYVNDPPERITRWPERWLIRRPDGSFALYLVNWGGAVNRPLSALTDQNPRAGRSAGGHCSYLPTTHE